jgi:hypothetical protein
MQDAMVCLLCAHRLPCAATRTTRYLRFRPRCSRSAM